MTVDSTPFTQSSTITFNCGAAFQEILRLDDKGMTYLGKRIEDAGEAHRAFLEAMSRMNPPKA